MEWMNASAVRAADKKKKESSQWWEDVRRGLIPRDETEPGCCGPAVPCTSCGEIPHNGGRLCASCLAAQEARLDAEVAERAARLAALPFLRDTPGEIIRLGDTPEEDYPVDRDKFLRRDPDARVESDGRILDSDGSGCYALGGKQ